MRKICLILMGKEMLIAYKRTSHFVHLQKVQDHLVLSHRDRLGLQLVYCSPCFLPASLANLAEVISAVMLEKPKAVVLDELNTHTGTTTSISSQDFMASM